MRRRSTRRLVCGVIVLAGMAPPSASLARSAVAPPAATAQDARAPRGTARDTTVRRLEAARATGGMAIDGRLNESAWRGADVATGFLQFEPASGEPATQRTEARVLYDEENLYIGIRLFDASPDSVVQRLARRDQDVFSDWATVFIDSREDRRTAFAFALNAAGLQRDELLFDDDQRDPDWDAVWEGAARIADDGWTAEFRLPHSQLRFSTTGSDGTADRAVTTGGPDGERGTDGAGTARSRSSAAAWGINFGRYIARRDEMVYWSPIPRDEGVFVSRFGRLDGLTTVEAPRGVEIAPYTVGRLTRAPGDAMDPFHRENEPSGSAGVDVRVGVGSGLTLNATVNPDFGQVEADPSVVNLTAFETFYPEKRPFFLEGADLFRLRGVNVFYPRRIGRSPQGAVPADAPFAEAPASATILGAAKLSGKTDDGWSIGVLDAVTDAETARYIGPDQGEHTTEVEPAANYAIARIAREFRGGRTAVGGIATATHRRISDRSPDGLRSAAYVGGLDARHRFAGDRYEVSGAAVGSHVRGGAEAIAATQRAAGRYFQRPGATHLELDPTRPSLSGLSASASVARIAGGNWRWSAGGQYTGPGFEINDLGFQHTSDRMGQNTSLRYVDYGSGGAFREWSIGVHQTSGWTTGGERLDVNGMLRLEAELTSGWGGGAWAMRHEGGIDPDALRGGPALISPGRYMGGGSVYSDRRRSVNGVIGYYWEVEDGTDGSVLRLNGGVTVRPTPRMDLSVAPVFERTTSDWQYVTRRTVDGEPHYVLGRLRRRTANVAARLNYTLSPTLSLQAYAQPFIGSGEYARLQTVRDPLADAFADRFRGYGADESSVDTADGSRTFRIAPGGDDADAFSLEPDFNVKELRSNLVLRWEYRPGSTVFLVWTQDRAGFSPDGSFRLGRDVRRLTDAPARNVFLVKVDYWIGL